MNCKDCIPSEGVDKCFRGNLPGVEYACCGHGKEGYIKFTNGMVITGKFTDIFHEDDPHVYVERNGIVGITRDPEVIATLENAK
jgi:hypothetical protein